VSPYYFYQTASFLYRIRTLNSQWISDSGEFLLTLVHQNQPPSLGLVGFGKTSHNGSAGGFTMKQSSFLAIVVDLSDIDNATHINYTLVFNTYKTSSGALAFFLNCTACRENLTNPVVAPPTYSDTPKDYSIALQGSLASVIEFAPYVLLYATRVGNISGYIDFYDGNFYDPYATTLPIVVTQNFSGVVTAAAPQPTSTLLSQLDIYLIWAALGLIGVVFVVCCCHYSIRYRRGMRALKAKEYGQSGSGEATSMDRL